MMVPKPLNLNGYPSSLMVDSSNHFDGLTTMIYWGAPMTPIDVGARDAFTRPTA